MVLRSPALSVEDACGVFLTLLTTFLRIALILEIDFVTRALTYAWRWRCLAVVLSKLNTDREVSEYVAWRIGKELDAVCFSYNDSEWRREIIKGVKHSHIWGCLFLGIGVRELNVVKQGSTVTYCCVSERVKDGSVSSFVRLDINCDNF